MFKKYFSSAAVLFSIFFVHTSHAQNDLIPVIPYYATVSGMVYALQRGDALHSLSNVNVEIERYTSDTTFYAMKSVRTDNLGKFLLDSIPGDFFAQYHITVSTDGYQRKQISMYVSLDTAFSIALIPSTDDSITFTPANPVSTDSIDFNLYNASLCCCTAYYNKSVSVYDTTIYLSYTFDETICQICDCMGSGSWANFSTGPLAAGKYAVYKAGNPYCPPGRDCMPASLAPVRVGTLVVEPSTGVFYQARAKVQNGFKLNSNGTTLLLNLTKSSDFRLRAYDLQGVLLGELLSRKLPAGSHRISLSSLGNKLNTRGNFILNISVDGATEALKVISVAK